MVGKLREENRGPSELLFFYGKERLEACQAEDGEGGASQADENTGQATNRADYNVLEREQGLCTQGIEEVEVFGQKIDKIMADKNTQTCPDDTYK